jgi:hypothetical protein
LTKPLDSAEDVRDDIYHKLDRFRESENAGSGGSPTKQLKKVGNDEVVVFANQGKKFGVKVREIAG